MNFCGILVVFLSLSTAACGLKCYMCALANPNSCTGTLTCPANFNRCFSMKIGGNGNELVTKGCQWSTLCTSSMNCCEGDLCNSAKIPTGSSLLLLLASSALTMMFL